ncbi:MAG TPA: hypothetical protein VFO40_12635, partial [Chthoniobacterales bacterium]|nr:hypothetical protein [Chthoniobacterales bacterium]
VPIRPSRRDDRNDQMWSLSAFRVIENDPSSLPGRTALKNADPALKCWAIFVDPSGIVSIFLTFPALSAITALPAIMALSAFLTFIPSGAGTPLNIVR